MLNQPFAIPAALFVVLALPLVLGLVPPNRVYGVRTPRTLADRDAWYRANRAGGVAIVLASAVYFAVALAFPYAKGAANDLSVWGLHLAAFVLPLAIGLAAAVRAAGRAAGGA